MTKYCIDCHNFNPHNLNNYRCDGCFDTKSKPNWTPIRFPLMFADAEPTNEKENQPK